MSVTQLTAKQTPLLSAEVKKYLGKVSLKKYLNTLRYFFQDTLPRYFSTSADSSGVCLAAN